MSVKSERRAWYAANVEPKPAGEAVGSPVYMDWVKRANKFMAARCVLGSAELRAEFVPESAEVVAHAAAQVAPVEVAPVKRAVSATDARDREEYAALIDAMRYKIADHMGYPGQPWDDFFKPQRYGADARQRPKLEFCKGAFKIAAPHLTEEMHRLLDAGVWRWVTFAEFKAERIAERAAELEAYRESEEDFASHCDAMQPF